MTADLAPTLSALRVGVADPCWRADASGAWWWATRTPAGPLTVCVTPDAGEVGVEAWGEGVAWLPDHLGALVGAGDPGPGDDASPLVRRLAERFPRHRVAATSRLVDAGIQGVCRRGVSAFEAARAWSLMVDAMGDDAPGPGGLRLPPAPRRVASCDPYELHVMGLEHGRADEVRRIASHATRLEVAGEGGADTALAHLSGIAGVGADAVAHARAVAMGDPDAVPVLDAHQTSAALRVLRAEGAVGADLAALLEPHAPDRGRLVRLLALAATVEPTA